jgi:ubiquinone/menaquinone biosynthesis C-methylase UbiE
LPTSHGGKAFATIGAVSASLDERRARDDRHFDRWARRYDRSPTQWLLFGPVQRSVVAAVAPHIPDGGAVLDIGCGTGRLLERLRSAAPRARLVGVDRSTGMTTAARQLRPRLPVEQGTAEALPHRDGAFDAVVTTISFHHWSDKRAGVGEVFRVLRPGGVFALTDISVDDLPSRPAALWARARASMDDMPPLAERARILEAAGFHVVEHRRALHGRWVTLTLAARPAAPVPPPV